MTLSTTWDSKGFFLVADRINAMTFPVNRALGLLLLLACACVSFDCFAQEDVSGSWSVMFNGRTAATLTLRQAGSTVTGNLTTTDGTPGVVTGSMNASTLTLSRNTGLDTIQHYQVTVRGNTFTGGFRNEGRYPDSGSFTGSRKVDAANAPMDTQRGNAIRAPATLTGPWVHSADARTQTPDSRVIVIQDGNNVAMTHAWKTRDKWVTLVCHGAFSNNDLHLQCAFAQGGNPFGFASVQIALKVSADGNHLDGAVVDAAANRQESHYSRVP